jgi:hypothetical protein
MSDVSDGRTRFPHAWTRRNDSLLDGIGACN